MQFSPTTVETITELMRWRRDVRHFRADPVAPEILARLQRAMELAPSVGNSRPWRVLMVESPELRAAVKEEFTRCNAHAAELYESDQAAAYVRLKLAGLDKAPVQLAVFTDLAPEAGHGVGRQTMPETLEQSTAMAIHALWLAARAENLGLGLVSILEPAIVANLFGAPPNWRFSAYICLGWPEFTDDTPLLHRVDWQRNTALPWRRV
jgi:5,6-dimethylbenzimidazole synthase